MEEKRYDERREKLSRKKSWEFKTREDAKDKTIDSWDRVEDGAKGSNCCWL